MSTDAEILKLRILLSFLRNDETCTVTGISRTLGESKQNVSRSIIRLEEEGLIDRKNTRHPCLTDKGRKRAEYYSERINISLNHLMYEGVGIENARNDACRWALYNSDETMDVIRSAEKKYAAKLELRDRMHFTGADLCRKLADGEYQLPFIIYREHVSNGTNISMANRGFEHPCTLIVKNSVGTLLLKATRIEAASGYSGKLMSGTVKTLKYFDNGSFISAEKSGEVLSMPMDAVSFVNIGEGIGQVLHGTLCLKMQCTAGSVHMPESTAIFTVLL